MNEMQDKYIRFDWAIKRLLRQKANFDVLEGFLTVFIGERITIVELLESEGNQLSAEDKFNRVDIKALNSKGEIIIIEIQNTRELYYLERILYGVAKAIVSRLPSEIFPEYILIRVNEFNKVAVTPLEEWMAVFVPTRRLPAWARRARNCDITPCPPPSVTPTMSI